jgi:hypothetical protein
MKEDWMYFQENDFGQAWWHMPVIRVLKRLRQVQGLSELHNRSLSLKRKKKK